MQEGQWANVVAIKEKKTEARVPGHPLGSRRATRSLAAACGVNDWMPGLDEEASNGEVRGTGNVHANGYEQSSTHAWPVSGAGRWHRQQQTPGNPRPFSWGSPSSGDGSSNQGSDQSSLHSTTMRESCSSHRSACAGRGLWVKVNLLIFKDEKYKDGWWWDVAIFHQSCWDDQHLLPYIFCSLQEFLGNLARSLGKEATLSDVLQTLDEHCGVVMTFNALKKELNSLKQGSSENVAEFRVHILQQVQILQSKYPGRIQPEHIEEMKCNHFYEGISPEYQWMLAHKVDGEHPASYSDLVLAAQKLQRLA